MDGLVNKAVQDLVCRQFGEDTWQAIKRKAGVEDDVFVSMEAQLRCSDILGGATNGSVRLHSYSTRGGLGPMVVGLLHGLGKMFNTKLEVAHEARRGEGSDHNKFLIRWNA